MMMVWSETLSFDELSSIFFRNKKIYSCWDTASSGDYLAGWVYEVVGNTIKLIRRVGVKETKEMGMNFKVGNIYKCGTEKVKVLHYEPRQCDGGNGADNRGYPLIVATSLDEFNEINLRSANGASYIGLFCGITGSAGLMNPFNLSHTLTEVYKAPKEMTVAEVRKALGMKEELKIVEG